MLHRAAAANAEVAAARHGTLRARAQHLRHRAEVEVAAASPAREGDALAGHAAIDEDDLAVDVRDADALVVDRLDEGFAVLRVRRYWHCVVGDPKTWRWIDLVTAMPFTVYASVPVLPVAKVNVIWPTCVGVVVVHGFALNTGPVTR